jgi:hypothetical protein
LALTCQCPAEKFAGDTAADHKVLNVLDAHNGAPFRYQKDRDSARRSVAFSQ